MKTVDKWICTDPDMAQYCYKVDDFTWSYIEARPYGIDGKGRVVSHAVVDIRDYTLDELWAYCSSYYGSYEEMVSQYGFREALHIMAECVFEQLSFEEMEINVEQIDMGKAIKFIHSWISEQ